MISSKFVKVWEVHYDAQKYPVDFYQSYISHAREANKPEELREDLLALLHWKDGKTHAFVPGENHSKPYTLEPILTTTSADLANFMERFRNLAQAGENEVTKCTEELRCVLSRMWNTVVIPAFLLHVARPDRLPIIDQHTVRAFLALTSGKIIEKPTITWHLWGDYIEFFQDAVVAAGYGHDLETCYKVDRALFAWGKSLKNTKGTKPLDKQGQVRNSPCFWGQPVPNTGIIPPSCNVLKALQEYLKFGSFDSLPQFKKQNLRDLQFRGFEKSQLQELLHKPGGTTAGKILEHYKKGMGGGADISKLPRPILDVFLVGWLNICRIHGTTRMANQLQAFGFGGTQNAACAAVMVGKTTGRLFGLLDDSDTPTTLFHNYFRI